MDVTPLQGPQSGVGRAVRGWWDALSSRSDVQLVGWTSSWRDRSGAEIGATPLPLPAALAVPLWQHVDRPRVDRRLGRPDVVHATNHVAPAAGAPRILTIMDLSFVLDPTDVTPGVQRFDRSIEAAVRRGVHVHTISQYIAEAIHDRYGAVATVVPPVVLPVGGRVRERQVGPPTVLAIGNFVRRKRFPLLVEAFAQMAAADHEVRLVVVGAPGSDSAAVDATVSRLPTGVAARVQITGRRGDDELADLIDRADVLAHPSIYEGFGLPVLESMAAGLPVVAARAPAVAEAAGDAARLVAPDDADALATALAEVMSDGAEQRRMVDAGFERARRFAAPEIAERLVSMYRSVDRTGTD